MKLYLIRHADPDYENDCITEKGICEARELGKRAGSLDLTQVFTSPMGRARETGRYVADGSGLEPSVLDWTAELNNLYKETPFGHRPVWDIPPEYYLEPGKISKRKSPHIADDMPAHDEILATLQTLGRHSDDFFKGFGYRRQGSRYAVESHSDAQVAIVCHLGFSLTLLSHLLRIPLDRVWTTFWLPPASITAVLMEEHSESWAVPRLVSVGDVAHLYGTGLHTNTMGLKGNTR